jgi:hypothetical protein
LLEGEKEEGKKRKESRGVVSEIDELCSSPLEKK